MKRYVEIEPVCPFVGKQCIKDGWQWNSIILHPCAFYDESVFEKDCNPQEPCRIKRAINRILSDEVQEELGNYVPEVPWDVEEGSADNVKKTKQ